jgi:diaminopimelate decarboxylase
MDDAVSARAEAAGGGAADRRRPDGSGPSETAFPRVAGTVCCEGVPLPAIADAVGTPTYVYSATAIRVQYRALDGALGGVPHRIHYSVKANANLALLRLLRSLGAGVDIVSGGELHRVRAAGYQGADVVFSGVGKAAGEIRDALAAGVRLINAESEGELDVISAEAMRAGVMAPVALRVNPEVAVSTPHPYIRTGERGTKFGIGYDEAPAAAARARRLPGVRLSGLDMHLGSQIAGTEPYAEGARRLVALYHDLVRAGATDLAYLDVGGGLAVPYGEVGEGQSADPDAFAAVVAGAVAPTGLTLLVEPGRYLVGNAGALLTRVLYRKRSGAKTYVVTDAGMTELLRPSHYSAYHRIEAVGPPTGGQSVVDVVGPVCETGDFFALDRALDDVGPGDLLVIHSAGAYGFAMASNYNARPRPAEVIVDGTRYAVATTRETYEDLVRHEQSTLAWRDASCAWE